MYIILNDELCHHGIKGQRWGVRHPDSKAKDWQNSVPFYNNYD